MNKYKVCAFNGQAKKQYWQKTPLDDLPGGAQYEKIQNTEGQHPRNLNEKSKRSFDSKRRGAFWLI